MKFFSLAKIKTHAIDKPIAIIPLRMDPNNSSYSPYPEIEMGPKIVTAIPPPIKIRIHIKNKNPKSCP